MNLKRRYNKSVSQSPWLIFLSCILCIVVIGYAALSRQVKVNGTANVPKTSWDVHFTNIRVFGGSVAASISSDKTSINLNEIKLKQSRDYYKFLVDVENTGTLDAKITSINIPAETDKLEVKVTYRDGTALNINDILEAKKKKTLLVVIRHKEVATLEEISTNLTIALEYGQADGEVNYPTTEYTVDDLINITNGASTESYASNSIQSEMYAFAHDKTDQLEATFDYRYIGGGSALTTKPDNYIKFNTYNGQEEMWRIIGIFQTNDGKNRLKIIKDTRLTPKMPWDYKKSGVGSSTTSNGSNLWTDAQLMYFLNPDDIATNATAKGYTIEGNYVKSGSTVIYENGKIPAEVASGATTYGGTVNNWRVSADALTKVDSVKYYLGGSAWNNSNSTYGTGEEIYTWERGTTGINNSTAEADLSWTGKVALMYPSDYLYTFAKGIDTTCFENGVYCSSDKGGVPGKSWIYNSATQWTLAPSSINEDCPLGLYSAGGVYDLSAGNFYGVRPVVYLKSDIKLSGSGTEQDPYVIIN